MLHHIMVIQMIFLELIYHCLSLSLTQQWWKGKKMKFNVKKASGLALVW